MMSMICCDFSGFFYHFCMMFDSVEFSEKFSNITSHTTRKYHTKFAKENLRIFLIVNMFLWFHGVGLNLLAGVTVAGWLIETTLLGWVSDFISVCLEIRWLGPQQWFLSPGTLS